MAEAVASQLRFEGPHLFTSNGQHQPSPRMGGSTKQALAGVSNAWPRGRAGRLARASILRPCRRPAPASAARPAASRPEVQPPATDPRSTPRALQGRRRRCLLPLPAPVARDPSAFEARPSDSSRPGSGRAPAQDSMRRRVLSAANAAAAWVAPPAQVSAITTRMGSSSARVSARTRCSNCGAMLANASSTGVGSSNRRAAAMSGAAKPGSSSSSACASNPAPTVRSAASPSPNPRRRSSSAGSPGWSKSASRRIGIEMDEAPWPCSALDQRVVHRVTGLRLYSILAGSPPDHCHRAHRLSPRDSARREWQ